MQLDILCNDQVLSRLSHGDQIYAEAPPVGDYTLRLTNDSPNTRLAVVSVDGVNVINGKDAGYDGAGFVLRPWESLPIKGWLRSNQEVAAFTFKPSEGSYAAETGRGTKNVGVIGVAVFDEKLRPFAHRPRTEHHHHHHYHRSPFDTLIRGLVDPLIPDDRFTCGLNEDEAESLSNLKGFGATRSAKSVPRSRSTTASYSTEKSSAGIGGGPIDAEFTSAEEIGTGYGRRLTQHTRTVTFERATSTPTFVLQVRYATRETLRAWGVPVDEATAVAAAAPNPFPAAPGFAQPPAGWR